MILNSPRIIVSTSPSFQCSVTFSTSPLFFYDQNCIMVNIEWTLLIIGLIFLERGHFLTIASGHPHKQIRMWQLQSIQIRNIFYIVGGTYDFFRKNLIGFFMRFEPYLRDTYRMHSARSTRFVTLSIFGGLLPPCIGRNRIPCQTVSKLKISHETMNPWLRLTLRSDHLETETKTNKAYYSFLISVQSIKNTDLTSIIKSIIFKIQA